MRLRSLSEVSDDFSSAFIPAMTNKYRVTYSDGTPTDPSADYVVLRIDGGGASHRAARQAIALYASLVRSGVGGYQNEALADELVERLRQYITNDIQQVLNSENDAKL